MINDLFFAALVLGGTYMFGFLRGRRREREQIQRGTRR